MNSSFKKIMFVIALFCVSSPLSAMNRFPGSHPKRETLAVVAGVTAGIAATLGVRYLWSWWHADAYRAQREQELEDARAQAVGPVQKQLTAAETLAQTRQQEIADAQAVCVAAEANYAKERSALNAQIASLCSLLDENVTAQDDLQRAQEALRISLAQKQQAKSAAEQELRLLQKELEDAQASARKAQAEHAAEQQQLATQANNIVDRLEQQVNEKIALIQAQEARIAQMEQNLTKHERELAELWAERTRLGEENADLAKIVGSLVGGHDPREHPFARFITIGEDYEMNCSRPERLFLPTGDGVGSDTADHPVGGSVVIERSEINLGFDDLREDAKYDGYTCSAKTVKPSLRDGGQMALICVHGTCSDTKSFGDDFSKNTTRNIIDFAVMLGMAHGCSVKVISFRWSGALKKGHRQEAGEFLNRYIRDHGNEFNKGIWVIAHSHGCNVVNWATKAMVDNDNPYSINTAIYLASPLADVMDSGAAASAADAGAPATPPIFNIPKVYHFYGTKDVTQMLGSIQSRWTIGRRARDHITSPAQVYNIRVQVGGNDTDHINIKEYVMEHLAWLLHAIDTYYSCFFDLDANLTRGDDNNLIYPMVAIREMQIQQFPGSIRANCMRALEFSSYQDQRFRERYDDRSINETASKICRVITAPIQEYLGSARRDDI